MSALIQALAIVARESAVALTTGFHATTAICHYLQSDDGPMENHGLWGSLLVSYSSSTYQSILQAQQPANHLDRMSVNTLLRFSSVCPFLGHTSPQTLRALAKTHGVNNMSSLTARAMKCPMMGPKLAAIAQARAFASVAEPKEVAEMHRVSGRFRW